MLYCSNDFTGWKNFGYPLSGKFRVTLPSMSSPNARYPINPMETNKHVIKPMPIFNTHPKSSGRFISFSKGNTYRQTKAEYKINISLWYSCYYMLSKIYFCSRENISWEDLIRTKIYKKCRWYIFSFFIYLVIYLM